MAKTPYIAIPKEATLDQKIKLIVKKKACGKKVTRSHRTQVHQKRRVNGQKMIFRIILQYHGTIAVIGQKFHNIWTCGPSKDMSAI